MAKFNPDFDLAIEVDAAVKKKDHQRKGAASYGLVALGPFENVIYEACGRLPDCDSNEAEFHAILKALEFAKDLGYPKRIEIRSDSRTCVRQLQGRYDFHNTELNGLSAQCIIAMKPFDRVLLLWCPREYNKHADKLANAAFDAKPQRAIRKIRREAFPRLPMSERVWELGGEDD